MIGYRDLALSQKRKFNGELSYLYFHLRKLQTVYHLLNGVKLPIGFGYQVLNASFLLQQQPSFTEKQ